MKRIITIIAIIIGSLFVVGKSVAQTVKQTSIASESFDSFYAKFYSDSTFQASRTMWPLGGGENIGALTKPWKSRCFLKSPRFMYVKNNFDFYSFDKKPNLYTIVIGFDGTGMGIEYTYKKINSKWFLSSYTVFSN